MQTDPIGDKDDINLYAYVHNDPIDHVDPTGNEPPGTFEELHDEGLIPEAEWQGYNKGLDVAGPLIAGAFGGEALGALGGVSAVGRVFWSGGPTAMRAAMEWTAAHGGTTLEQTFTGKALTGLTKLFGFKNTEGLWKTASASFAKGAKGEVNVFLGENVRPNSIWNTVERDILGKGGNKIVEHPVTTAKPASGSPSADSRGPIASGCFAGGHGICPL